MSTEDEFTRKLAIANHAKGITNSAYAAATHIGALIRSGMTVRDVLRVTWRGLAPREADRLPEDVLDAFAPLLELLVPMMSDGPEPERMIRAISGMRATIGGGNDPEFTGVLDAMEKAAHRIGVDPPPSPSRSVEALIRRLLKEATSPLPDQAPAIQGGVVLFGVPMMFEGALSETPDGGLRLLSPVPNQPPPPRRGGRVEMIEQFFGYDDVVVFAVRRQVNIEAPRIIQTS